jgi:hypothetical protein
MEQYGDESTIDGQALCLSCFGNGSINNDVLSLSSLTLSQTITKQCIDCGGTGKEQIQKPDQGGIERQAEEDNGRQEPLEGQEDPQVEEGREEREKIPVSWGLLPDLVFGFLSQCLARLFGLLLIIATRSAALVEGAEEKWIAVSAVTAETGEEACTTATGEEASTASAEESTLSTTAPAAGDTERIAPARRPSTRTSLLQFHKKTGEAEIGGNHGSRAVLRKRSTATALSRKVSGEPPFYLCDSVLSLFRCRSVAILLLLLLLILLVLLILEPHPHLFSIFLRFTDSFGEFDTTQNNAEESLHFTDQPHGPAALQASEGAKKSFSL